MHSLFSLLLILSIVVVSKCQDVLIGELSTLAHGVRGKVFAINSRQLRITGLTYDGAGPAAFFWTGTGSVNSDGRRVPFRADCSIPERLPAYDGDTVELELPNNLELADVEYLSMWCEIASQDFGNVRIDATALQQVPDLPQPSCTGGGVTETAAIEPFPVQENWNCEPLNDDYQVRWVVDADNLDIELVARIDNTQYMGFGVSGSDTKTDMDKSDVAIAYQNGNDFAAVDYFMTDRQPCSSGVGVCPDTQLVRDLGTNDISGVSGKAEGDLTMIRYTRSLAAVDSIADRPVSTSGPTFITWAVGPLNPSSLLPLFHGGQLSFPRRNVSIEFGRSISDNCSQKLVIKDKVDAVPGFLRPTISNTTIITARIGPPGGSRGYAGINQGPSWGFAWYMSPTGSSGEDVLIPAIAVERGKKYVFTVQGGVGDGTEQAFHPLYITDSAMGGYSSRTPEQRGEEKVFAGIGDIITDENGGVTSFKATATGALCDIKSSLEGDTINLETWEEYAETLDLSCTKNMTIQSSSGTLEWTVPNDAPDLLYYQCVTHPFLGFKVVVFEEGKVDLDRLKRENGGGSLVQEDTPTECKVTFKGVEKPYKGCRKDLTGDVEVYWTLREAEGEIDTLFRARTNGGYVGFGWGFSAMVGSNVVIAFADQSGKAEIRDYFMQSRSREGVQPNNNLKLRNTGVEVVDGFVTGIFTRALEIEGIPTITNGNTPAIWAVGSIPNSARSLTRHETRSRGQIDLSKVSGGVQDDGGLTPFFTAHAILMITGWLALTPTAVIVMKYLQGLNPITFQLHRGLNTVSVVAILSAYIMAIIRGSHTHLAHLSLGSIALILALIQVVSGALRPQRDAAGRKPWYFSHAGMGYTALHTAMANAIVGMIIFKVSVGWYIAWGILVAAYVSAHILLFLFRSRIPYENVTPEQEVKET